ncbi:hypothetical protein EL17_21575 [Anditalea andensis]|uniref:Gylcosyl hydrolase 115 C-terminal domain-containing protein n=2 Tax=Anditalea andensis TaxID=1048983 RepID=A0A074KU36_9BACT|nr:hypothetical protein EL17_21575 [Anditalea andensis]
MGIFTVCLLSVKCSAVRFNDTSVSLLQEFTFTKEVAIIYDPKGSALDSIVAHLFSQDLEKITGIKLKVTSDYSTDCDAVFIGNIHSSLFNKLIPHNSIDITSISGKWEQYIIKAVSTPENNRKTLIIAGSDDRGTAFGVFEISRLLGVSPWHWWADVPVNPNDQPVVTNLPIISEGPTVKYRGIFINDEDWGLQPWAAKTFDPGTGDIGTKTYEKVFELLLRLKANLIWPAMHPSTKAFFYYPGNVAMAKEYQIVIGSSHAEPMLRNNVDEWDKSKRGAFNYLTNRKGVQEYWEERIKDSGDLHGIYTLGMRGIHDSGMEGVSEAEAVEVLQSVIDDQRNILGKYHKIVEDVPQAFTAYKEVLDVYDQGLIVPDDVILVWPDDNYGYIKRLANRAEQSRKGGSGVYYHTSYWGRPHDYLWLNTTHPSLIRYEMIKAYERGSRALWVLNVGDIKPHEYSIQLFLDMAYSADAFMESKSTKVHFTGWHHSIFGSIQGQKFSDAMWEYYKLAFERKPEFMGWSQTEPTRPVQNTGYNHMGRGDEAQKRLNAYEVIEHMVSGLKIPENLFPAYYQLIYYPIRAASLINKKFIYRDKAFLASETNKLAALNYKEKSHQAYHDIVEETRYFNQELLDGKWENMMDMAPRKLPVFEDPDIEIDQAENRVGNQFSIRPEVSYGSNQSETLPKYNSWIKSKYFIDIVHSHKDTSGTFYWKASTSHDWIKLSDNKGNLYEDENFHKRIWVDVDWEHIDTAGSFHQGQIIIETPLKSYTVTVLAENRPGLPPDAKHVENDQVVVIYAENYSNISGSNEQHWERVEDFGHSGTVMESGPIKMTSSVSETVEENSPTLSYDFYTFNEADQADVIINALPTHPLTDQYKLRIGISVDNSPIQIIDFKTQGRSEEWKQNVLSNKSSKSISIGKMAPGKHTLKIHMIDPGVLLDFIYIDMGGLNEGGSVLEETMIGKTF